MGTRHTKTSSKTREFLHSLSLQLLKSNSYKSVQGDKHKAYRIQTICDTALRYTPNLQTVEAMQCPTVGVNIPSLTYSSQLNNSPRRSETAMFTMQQFALVRKLGVFITVVATNKTLPISAVELITNRIDVNIIDTMAEHPGDVEFDRISVALYSLLNFLQTSTEAGIVTCLEKEN